MHHGLRAEPVVSTLRLVRFPPQLEVREDVSSRGSPAERHDNLARGRVPSDHTLAIDALVPQHVVIVEAKRVHELLNVEHLLVPSHLVDLVHGVRPHERLQHPRVRDFHLFVGVCVVIKCNFALFVILTVRDGGREPQARGRHACERQAHAPEARAGQKLHRAGPYLDQPQEDEVENQQHRHRDPGQDVVAQEHVDQLVRLVGLVMERGRQPNQARHVQEDVEHEHRGRDDDERRPARVEYFAPFDKLLARRRKRVAHVAGEGPPVAREFESAVGVLIQRYSALSWSYDACGCQQSHQDAHKGDDKEESKHAGVDRPRQLDPVCEVDPPPPEVPPGPRELDDLDDGSLWEHGRQVTELVADDPAEQRPLEEAHDIELVGDPPAFVGQQVDVGGHKKDDDSEEEDIVNDDEPEVPSSPPRHVHSPRTRAPDVGN